MSKQSYQQEEQMDPQRDAASQPQHAHNCLEEHRYRRMYTTCGVIWALCIPCLGLICCLGLSKRVCSHCGHEIQKPQKPQV